MIKFNVLYPCSEGARFDHAYYRDKHMPMLAEQSSAARACTTRLTSASREAPGTPSPYLASCSVFCAVDRDPPTGARAART